MRRSSASWVSLPNACADRGSDAECSASPVVHQAARLSIEATVAFVSLQVLCQPFRTSNSR